MHEYSSELIPEVPPIGTNQDCKVFSGQLLSEGPNEQAHMTAAQLHATIEALLTLSQKLICSEGWIQTISGKKKSDLSDMLTALLQKLRQHRNWQSSA